MTGMRGSAVWVGALLLSACSQGTPADAPSPLDDYHAFVRADAPQFSAGRSDAYLDAAGRDVCRVMESDVADPWRATLARIVANGVDEREAAAIALHATATFCPDRMSGVGD